LQGVHDSAGRLNSMLYALVLIESVTEAQTWKITTGELQ